VIYDREAVLDAYELQAVQDPRECANFIVKECDPAAEITELLKLGRKAELLVGFSGPMHDKERREICHELIQLIEKLRGQFAEGMAQ